MSRAETVLCAGTFESRDCSSDDVVIPDSSADCDGGDGEAFSLSFSDARLMMLAVRAGGWFRDHLTRKDLAERGFQALHLHSNRTLMRVARDILKYRAMGSNIHRDEAAMMLSLLRFRLFFFGYNAVRGSLRSL